MAAATPATTSRTRLKARIARNRAVLPSLPFGPAVGRQSRLLDGRRARPPGRPRSTEVVSSGRAAGELEPGLEPGPHARAGRGPRPPVRHSARGHGEPVAGLAPLPGSRRATPAAAATPGTTPRARPPRSRLTLSAAERPPGARPPASGPRDRPASRRAAPACGSRRRPHPGRSAAAAALARPLPASFVEAGVLRLREAQRSRHAVHRWRRTTPA